MKIILFVVIAFVLLSALRTRFLHFLQRDETELPATRSIQTNSGTATVSDAERFSPASDLEALDIAQLRKARSTIDIAMYAFTDRRIAEELAHTDSSVQIRLYRDGEQFESEQRHATYTQPSTTQMLAGRSRIHIRVKRDSSREYMHSKEVLVDGIVLRDGSANWSKSALRLQDNSWFLITGRQDIARFTQKFNEVWDRPTNLIVQ
jgi:phosphatidylserine/phosphatidylglycerophosphate/cardiolipin synthase-like enzyme